MPAPYKSLRFLSGQCFSLYDHACVLQATLQGFQSRGLSSEQSETLLRRSVEIAQEARAIFVEGRSKGPYAGRENDGSRERRPVLVAASVGSYGAYLADGSEYTYVPIQPNPNRLIVVYRA